MAWTYFFPIQFLGPNENGLTTAKLSFAYFSSPSQRSGTKVLGSVKLRLERFAGNCETYTEVCETIDQQQLNHHRDKVSKEDLPSREPNDR